MQLKLAVTNRMRDTMGDNYACVFSDLGGTIGRASHNQWVLPDSKRYVSSVHASIEHRDGRFFLIDTSMNGVFVNGADKPQGPSDPVELKIGMKLRMGNYHIAVADIRRQGDSQVATMVGAHLLDDNKLSFNEAFDTPAVQQDTGAFSDMTRQQTGNTGAYAKAVDDLDGFSLNDLASINEDLSQELLVEDDIAEKLDLESLLDDRIASVNKSMVGSLENVGSTPAKGVSRANPSTTETIAVERTEAHTPNVLAMPGSEIPATEKNFRALIEGLGIDRAALESRSHQDIARAVGAALREAVAELGIMRTARARSKQALSMPPSQQDIDDLAVTDLNDDIVDLLLGRGQIHQNAGDDMRAALSAVRLHNMALQQAAQDAFNNFLDQMSPDELQERFAASSSGRKGLFQSGKKAALWEQYERFYDVISTRQPGSLPEFIKQEYERAYLANLRTLERSEDSQ